MTMSISKHQQQLRLVFIPTPAVGNIVPLVEFALHLTRRHHRLSVTFLILALPQRPAVTSYVQSRASADAAISFIHLPPLDPPPPHHYNSSLGYISLCFEKQKTNVEHAIADLMSTQSLRVAALFVDMFSISMIDVANRFALPCYLFFASPASFLGFMLHLPALDTQLASDFVDSETGLIVPKDSTVELIIPSFANPLPPQILPTIVLKRRKDGYFWSLHHSRRYAETKGILINTFHELEPYAISSLSSVEGLPPVYPIGPILDLAGPAQWHPNMEHEGIMRWLDDQPPSSVVFLCFGSMGSMDGAQVGEIAVGLELAGYRFVWSIREPAKGKIDLPGEYANPEEVLPEGFLGRTAGIGLVCGWVLQAAILGHKAIGGFVSHCGWNSILESLWHGVPIATWPLYAEQQMNAFELVKELGLGVEIRLDYREGSEVVLAKEFERGVWRLMEGDEEVRGRVKQMKEKCRAALTEGGPSDKSIGSLIEELVAEI